MRILVLHEVCVNVCIIFVCKSYVIKDLPKRFVHLNFTRSELYLDKACRHATITDYNYKLLHTFTTHMMYIHSFNNFESNLTTYQNDYRVPDNHTGEVAIKFFKLADFTFAHSSPAAKLQAWLAYITINVRRRVIVCSKFSIHFFPESSVSVSCYINFKFGLFLIIGIRAVQCTCTVQKYWTCIFACVSN